MKIKELIEKLQDYDQDMEVTNAYGDNLAFALDHIYEDEDTTSKLVLF